MRNINRKLFSLIKKSKNNFKTRDYFVAGIFAFIILPYLFFCFQIYGKVNSSQDIQYFQIKSGQTVKEISANLSEQNLIKSDWWFRSYVWLKKKESGFLAGDYYLAKNLNAKYVLDVLTSDAETREKKIRIMEGWTNKQVAEYLESEELFTAEEFLTAVQQNVSRFKTEFDFLESKPDNVDLEGYLFPDTYRIYPDADIDSVIGKMLFNFGQKIDANMRDAIRKNGRTIHETITMASIVEKEGLTYSDRRMVADVFWRRVDYGRALQSCATINYITGKKQAAASLADLEIDSPYNTYKYPGLTPGPIGNSGLMSIQATVWSLKNSYWYFLNDKESNLYFSKTFEEHQVKKEKYVD